jgi:cell wall-associated NlpC family hydrolase
MTTNRGQLPGGFDRRVTAARPDLAARRLEGVVPAARYTDGAPMRVIAEAACLRDTQALHGETLVVYDMDDEGWAWAQLDGDGYVGYLSANDLGACGPAASHRVAVPRTHVYAARSIKTPHLAALPMNAKVHVQDIEGSFARIEGVGFVHGAHLKPLDEPAADFVAIAELFEHAPYLWGGKTWLGVDCSGLVQTALEAAGLPAPRDTDMQMAALGSELPASAQLRRGDLVFWKGHVGIMCDSETLLHANGHAMQVTREPIARARARIAAAGFGEILQTRRL